MPDENIEGEECVNEKVQLASELIEKGETFEFPGINYESHANLKEAEEQYPAPVTPIDELIIRFENEGIKITLGKHPESGNVFVLPANSDDVVSDSIFPRDLDLAGVNDSILRELIIIDGKIEST